MDYWGVWGGIAYIAYILGRALSVAALESSESLRERDSLGLSNWPRSTVKSRIVGPSPTKSVPNLTGGPQGLEGHADPHTIHI